MKFFKKLFIFFLPIIIAGGALLIISRSSIFEYLGILNLHLTRGSTNNILTTLNFSYYIEGLAGLIASFGKQFGAFASFIYLNAADLLSLTKLTDTSWLLFGVFFSIILPLIGYILILILTEISMDLVSFFLLFFLIIMNSGAIIIGFTFLRVKKEPWLLQRQKVHLIVVYSRDGIQIYSKIFNKALSETKTALLTSSFSAITSLFQEATETAGAVKSVLLEDKELRIINKDYFVCAILEDYSTQASESAHENFTKDFEKSFKEKLEKFDGEVSVFEAADQIANKYFS